MMAKKAGKKSAVVQSVQPPTSSFDEMYPTIARWISQEEGWIELGADPYSRSHTRALYGGGMLWAVQARKWAEEKKSTGQVKGLMDKAITEMEPYLDDPTKEREERLHDLLRAIEKEQDEYFGCRNSVESDQGVM